MNNAYSCAVCDEEIASAATHVTAEYCQVVWSLCAENPASHAMAHPGCSVAARGVYDHAVVVGTHLPAHRWILRLRRAQEVASSA